MKGETENTSKGRTILETKETVVSQDDIEAELDKIFYSEEDMENIRCGIGPVKPKWMQIFAVKEILILVFTLSSIVQGMFFTYTVSVISTIEKRFKLSSTQIGVVLAGNDISAAMFASFLGYYLNGRHRSRWLGLGIILTAVASFVSALPHFIYGPGNTESELSVENNIFNQSGDTSQSDSIDLCFSGSEDLSPEEGTAESYMGPVIMLFISQFISGISMSIFFSIGIPLIDDNVSKKTMSLYYSVYLLLRVIGPVCGYLVGGKCLEYWIVPSHSVNITSKDPRWLGAWWIGFFFIGSSLVVLGISFALFPLKLPETLEREKRRILKRVLREDKLGYEINKDYLTSLVKSREGKSTKPTLKNMIRVTKKLFSNKIWAANIFNSVVAVLAMFGYQVFKPKYLEYQFRKSSSDASYYVGMASLVATCLGTVISAVVLRWIRPGPRLVTGYNIFVTIFGCLSYLLMMLIGCPPLEAVGPASPGSDHGLLCSSACGCSAKFLPVCSEDNSTLYYSPCYAACTAANTYADKTVYMGCSCIANSSSMNFAAYLTSISTTPTVAIHLLSGGTATRGYCPEPCDTFIYYITLEILTVAIFATGKIGSAIILLRAVDDADKGISIGIVEVCLALFGFIPAPLIMGWIIDSSCIVWDETRGVKGNCWLYDTDKFRILLHVVAAVLLLVSVLGDIVMFKYADCLDLYGDKEADTPLRMNGDKEADTPLRMIIKESETKTEEELKPISQGAACPSDSRVSRTSESD